MASDRRRWVGGIMALAVVLVTVVWVLLPWEWSMIDDPGLVLSIREAMDTHGALPGLFWHVRHMLEVDTDWGLFRPSYWVYPSLVYWLPIGLAHLLRLVLFVVAIAGPAVALRRRGASPLTVAVAVCVMLSGAASMMLGLIHISLQELSGAAFVGLGLWVRSPWLRVVMWVVAAWFKAPFVWLLVGEAVVLWREGRRKPAAIAICVALVTVVMAAVMARNGSYTSSYLDGPNVAAVIAVNLARLFDINLMLPLLATAWWWTLARTRPRIDRTAVVLLVGLVGYTLQMLPWVVTGHYQAGIAYLLSIFLISTFVEPAALGPRRAFVAIVVPIALAALAVTSTLWLLLATNARFRGITDCLVQYPDAQVVVATQFGPEAAVRIEQNLRLADPDWRGAVVYESPTTGLEAAQPGTVLVVSSSRAASLAWTRALCEVPAAVVLKVDDR